MKFLFGSCLFFSLGFIAPQNMNGAGPVPASPASYNCGSVVLLTNLANNGQLDLNALPVSVSVVYLLDSQGNILANLDISESRVFDISSFEGLAYSVYIPCENNAQSDRRIIVY